MSVVAYGDESVRRAGVAVPVYLLGAYLCEGDGAGLTAALSGFERGSKLHWRDTPKPVARRVCEVIGAHEAVHVVVAAAPLVGGVREERARQRALATLISLLWCDYGVDALVLERRQQAQDMKDQATAKVARLGGAVGENFELVHAYGGEDARLWVPDQVLGAYGDMLAGDARAWSSIEGLVRVEHVDLA